MARKHGNGEGSIQQRLDGAWEARITLEGGGRKSFYGKTRQEVASKLAAARRYLGKGLPLLKRVGLPQASVVVRQPLSTLGSVNAERVKTVERNAVSPWAFAFIVPRSVRPVSHLCQARVRPQLVAKAGALHGDRLGVRAPRSSRTARVDPLRAVRGHADPRSAQ
jgi:hypothetical protein